MTQEAAAATRHTPGPFHRSGQMGQTVTRRISGLHAVGVGTTAREASKHEIAWFVESDDAFLFAAAPDAIDLLRRLVRANEIADYSDAVGLRVILSGIADAARPILASLEGTTGPTTETED